MAESEARRLGVGISPADLARDIVHAAWGGRFLEYADVLADDFVWIGALPVQYRLSKEETLKVYGGGSWTIPNISFANDNFREVASSGGLHVVCGSTTVIVDPSGGMAYSGRPRVTSIFRKVGEGLELVHLHTSHPVPTVPGGGWSGAPTGVSRETIRFLCMLSAKFRDGMSLELRDLEGTTHVVRPFEIICLEADRQYTDIRVIGSSFRMRQGIGTLAELLPEELFIELRRGTMANVGYVTSWDENAVYLVDGVTVQLPNRRSKEILDALQEKQAAFERELERMGARLFRKDQERA